MFSALRVWKDVSRTEFENPLWQDRNALTRPEHLEAALSGEVSSSILAEIAKGITQVGMAIRLNPYVLSLIDWRTPEDDPIRRQFLPFASELEDDHPGMRLDSLEERDHSPVSGLVHRYPDKVLFLATSVCPVYCQYCTRSYAVGLDTALVQKDHVASAQGWDAALDYIRSHSQIEDVVVSGGDIARLRPSHVRKLGHALLDIEHIRRVRFATKALSVQPMKFFADAEWLGSLLDVIKSGRARFKDVCIHTHFNHPREVSPLVERAMRLLHEEGVVVRNQAVILRGVNADAQTLQSLMKDLGQIHIHPYYAYLCDMVKSTEHFRVALADAQNLEKRVRGSTAGFNTPLFVADTPGGKRDVHSAEFYDRHNGIAAFSSPAVSQTRLHYYFDPLRTLADEAREMWQSARAADVIDGLRHGGSRRENLDRVERDYEGLSA